jgi:hypothetical protein
MKFLIFLIAIYKITCEAGENRRPQFDESIFTKIKQAKTIKSETELKELLRTTDMTYLAFHYLKSSENSRLVAGILVSVAEKLNYLAGILLMDCDGYETENQKLCSTPEGVDDGFPKMMLYVPPEYKLNPYTNKVSEHSVKYYDKNEVSETFLYNFISQSIPSKSYGLTFENYDNFISSPGINKVILYTEKPKTPLLWRGLSTYFYEKLAFAHVFTKEQPKLLKGIDKYPTIVIHQVHEEGVLLDSPIIEKYEGDIDAEKLAIAFEKYALMEKISSKKAKEQKAVFKKLTKDDYASYFKKFPDKRFAVYLTETDDIPESVDRFNIEIAGFFQFVKFSCSDNFCKTNLKLKTLPQLVTFKYNAKEDIDSQLSAAKVLPHTDYNKIYKEVTELFLDSFTSAYNDSFQSIIYESITKGKFPILYLYEKGELPLGLYLLSTDANYKKHMDFITFEKPEKDIIRQFKLQQLPQLVFVVADPKEPES